MRTIYVAAASALVVAAAGGIAVGTVATGAEEDPKVTVTLGVFPKTMNVLGVPYEAWTYNGTVPGTIIRVTQGTDLTVVLQNGHNRAHSFHTHFEQYALSSDGSSLTAPLPIVPGQNDNVMAAIHTSLSGPTIGMNPIGMYMPREDVDVALPGQEYAYKFKATQVGNFLYHCHVYPASEHISHGQFGMIVVYPRGWTWEELPAHPSWGNVQAWVTAPDGTRYFEDVVMLSEVDLTGVLDASLVPSTGSAGKVHVANFRAWNDPYFLGPVKTGTPMRVIVADIGHEVHTWHLHGHVFKLVDKYDPAKRTVMGMDTMLIGPGESFETTLVAGKPGLWFAHDHIVPDAYAGNVPWLHVTE